MGSQWPWLVCWFNFFWFSLLLVYKYANKYLINLQENCEDKYMLVESTLAYLMFTHLLAIARALWSCRKITVILSLSVILLYIIYKNLLIGHIVSLYSPIKKQINYKITCASESSKLIQILTTIMKAQESNFFLQIMRSGFRKVSQWPFPPNELTQGIGTVVSRKNNSLSSLSVSFIVYFLLLHLSVPEGKK